MLSMNSEQLLKSIRADLSVPRELPIEASGLTQATERKVPLAAATETARDAIKELPLEEGRLNRALIAAQLKKLSDHGLNIGTSLEELVAVHESNITSINKPDESAFPLTYSSRHPMLNRLVGNGSVTSIRILGDGRTAESLVLYNPKGVFGPSAKGADEVVSMTLAPEIHVRTQRMRDDVPLNGDVNESSGSPKRAMPRAVYIGPEDVKAGAEFHYHQPATVYMEDFGYGLTGQHENVTRVYAPHNSFQPVTLTHADVIDCKLLNLLSGAINTQGCEAVNSLLGVLPALAIHQHSSVSGFGPCETQLAHCGAQLSAE